MRQMKILGPSKQLKQLRRGFGLFLIPVRLRLAIVRRNLAVAGVSS